MQQYTSTEPQVLNSSLTARARSRVLYGGYSIKETTASVFTRAQHCAYGGRYSTPGVSGEVK